MIENTFESWTSKQLLCLKEKKSGVRLWRGTLYRRRRKQDSAQRWIYLDEKKMSEKGKENKMKSHVERKIKYFPLPNFIHTEFYFFRIENYI